ncbi:type IX secretion system periplasmic lipoprotein PorW/SprE [Psychroflexus planctonicus]|uniref:type IX secretion system periplasmic lipoprotein PorW/SprE n=1 Tax=Psychroflexus planctonicus TaxID=1526575 RepID=UPI004032F158
MPKYKTSFIIGIVLLSLWGCSRKENKFVNRNFHAMTTYYNILYHGNIEMLQGINDVKQQNADHYFEVLPVERMAKLPPERNDTVPLNEYFGNAELKATRGIQKHSMFMGGREYNYQVDEAYLLLGKARYFDQRFIPAKDAFSFIINHYPDSEIITKAEIWLQKTNMRLNYDETALENLQQILAENSEILPEDLVEIYSTIGAIHIKLENYEASIEPIDLAAEYVETYDEKARWTYIKGQLYNQIGNKDSATASFEQVVEFKRRPPRNYMVHSLMEIFKNEDHQAEDTPYVKEYFQELHEDWENRNFLDFLYFESAQHYLKIDSIDLAIDYYNKSLREQPESTYLRSRDYFNLAEIYFDKASYKTSGFYYDSTMTNVDQSTREFRLIKKKRDNLDEVIKYEDIAIETDSILNLVEMDDQARIAYFTKYTNQLKEEAKSLFAQQKKDERMANVVAPQIGGFGGAKSNSGNDGSKQEFYFYNPAKISSGKTKFKRTWGDIALDDNWRLEGKKASKGNTNEDGEEEPEEDDNLFSDPQFDPQTYISEIPTDKKIIDSISEERTYAYFQLGVIYKEKFKENELAIERFKELLTFNNVDEKLILPTKYNLYLAYKNLDDQANTEVWKQNIIREHPNSRYAEILLNPRSLRDGENSPNKVYARLYRKFQKQDLKGLLEEIQYWEEEFTATPMLPKFKLLQAQVKGRLFGYHAYKEELELVALDHPQTKEGKKAQKLLNNLNGSMKNAKFKPDNNQDDFKLVYYFESDDYTLEELAQLKANIKQGLTELEYGQLKLSVDIYSKDYNFVLLHDLNSKLGSEGMAELLLENGVTLKEWEYFPISKDNYSILQIHKNMEEYLKIQ